MYFHRHSFLFSHNSRRCKINTHQMEVTNLSGCPAVSLYTGWPSNILSSPTRSPFQQTDQKKQQKWDSNVLVYWYTCAAKAYVTAHFSIPICVNVLAVCVWQQSWMGISFTAVSASTPAPTPVRTNNDVKFDRAIFAIITSITLMRMIIW